MVPARVIFKKATQLEECILFVYAVLFGPMFSMDLRFVCKNLKSDAYIHNPRQATQ